jgi:hypothetical protein
MRSLHGWLARLHDLAAGGAGAFKEIRARHRREAFQIGKRVFDRPVDQPMNDEAVPGRIDVRDAAVVALVMMSGRRDGAVAAL